jgi:hypothetical protein
VLENILFLTIFIPFQITNKVMPRIKKVLESREAWKQKASLRAEALREARKTKKRHFILLPV